MRIWRAALVIGVVGALLAAPAGAGASVVTDVDVLVAGAAGPEPTPERISCSGIAPSEPGCVKSMTLTGNFTIRIALATSYRGFLVIRGFTETGSTTIICDFVVTGPPCAVRYEGVYMVDQTWTMAVLAAGSGYWSVSAG